MTQVSSFVIKRWKTLALLLVIGSTGFVAGVVANQVKVVSVQPIAGTHVLVPSPDLVILGVFWDIDVISQNLTGLVLNVTVPAGTNPATYHIIISVSCINLTSGVEFWCSHGRGQITLGGAAAEGSALLQIHLFPQFDPELTEVHDLSFIVTSLPAVPVTPCTTPNCLPRP